jgi:hypothetical protein
MDKLRMGRENQHEQNKLSFVTKANNCPKPCTTENIRLLTDSATSETTVSKYFSEDVTITKNGRI